MSEVKKDLGNPQSGGGIFYGWWIVAVAFMTNFMATGTGFYLFNIFFKELQPRFDCDRGALSWAFSIFIAFGSFYQIILGRLINRFGVRSMMLLGGAAAGLAYLLMSRMTSLWQFYLLVGVLLSMGNASMSGVSANTIVARWFFKKRGTALGIATSGISLSGVLLPIPVALLLPRLGLETTFILIGVVICAVVWPLVLIFIKEHPEDSGLRADGVKESDDDESDTVKDDGFEHAEWSSGSAFRTGAFWKIALAYSAGVMAVSGVMLQLVPHFTDIGYTLDQASMFLAGTALLGAVGKISWGWLCDRFEIRRVIASLFFLQAVGLLILVVFPGHVGSIFFILVYGFPMGGVLATLPVIIARCFGSRSFSVVAGTMGPFLAFQAFGHPIMGNSVDISGSYNPAYAIFIAGLLAGAILVYSIRFPEIGRDDSGDQFEI